MIKLAAIKLEDGTIWTGKRHAYIIWEMLSTGMKPKIHQDQQGFVTDAGEFVDREEAGRIAYKCGQTTDWLKTLFSEDIIEVTEEDVKQANLLCAKAKLMRDK